MKICIFAFVLIISGCGQSIQKVSNQTQDRQELLQTYPEWWKHKPLDNKVYKYAVGGSDKSSKKARETARENLIKSLQIFIDAEEHWKEVSTEDSLAVDMVEYREEKYRATLPETEEIDTHRDEEKNMYYSLVRLERTALERRGKRDQELVRDTYKDARALWNRGKTFRSCQEYIKALSYARLLLEGAKFDHMELSGKEVLASQQIERELKQRLSEIKLRKEGDGQTGYFGKRLEEPLVVIATAKGRRVEGLPIVFRYRSGRGRLRKSRASTDKTGTDSLARLKIETETDSNGRASIEVIMIDSVSQRNEIVARMNLSSLLSQITERTENERKLLNRIFERRETSEIKKFHYKSLFASSSKNSLIVSINDSSEHQVFEDGSEVTLKIETAEFTNFRGIFHIFHVKADGSIWFKNTIRVDRPQESGHLIIRKTARGFEVEISGIKLVKKSNEPESEAFVVIAGGRRVYFGRDAPTTKEVIIKEFDRVAPDWKVGQVSYEIQ